MGDIPPDGNISQQPSSLRSSNPRDEIKQGSGPGLTPQSQGDSRIPGESPFYSQYSALPHLHSSRQSQQQSPMPYGGSPSHDHSNSNFNMSGMAVALPEYPTIAHSQQQQQPQQQQQGARILSGASTPALVYQMQQNLQYPGTPSNFQSQQQSYPGGGFAQGQFPGQYVHNQPVQANPYGMIPSVQQRTASTSPSFANFPQGAPQYVFYPSPYTQVPQMAQPYPPQGSQSVGFQGRRSSLPSSQMQLPGIQTDRGGLSGSLPASAGPFPGPAMHGGFGASTMTMNPRPGQDMYAMAPEASIGSVPRGPPRKPKQSGHALWVGNLPPETNILDLKDHFSRDATRDIESLFLISKSNCAFVNYRTEAACTAAMHRFHDSRFQSVRLVCRLRRSSAPSSGIPTGPSAMTGTRAPSQSPQRSPAIPSDEESSTPPTNTAMVDGESGAESKPSTTERVPEKYFIVKSLTLQDLELSVRNGIWATQSHNEESLNKAFELADNVYLIFSANKSGEYFGYSRMTSRINEDSTEIMSSIPKQTSAEASAPPKSIPTSATDTAPKGRIIDDSARGTIFWEADLSDVEEDGVLSDSEERGSAGVDGAAPQTWGKPFRIEWLSTNRLPFYRTRGLRNPWNANREVKIARDGTELEPSVGRRLIQMFHRLGPASAGPAGPPYGPAPPLIGGPLARNF